MPRPSQDSAYHIAGIKSGSLQCGIWDRPMTGRVKTRIPPERPHVSFRQQRTCCRSGLAALCRYCCKSPKLPGANFSAVKKSDRRPPIDVASITLPRSPVSLSSGDEVPHIFTRKSRLRPKEFLIASAKRLLQQNLPQARPEQAQQKSHHSTTVGTREQHGRRYGITSTIFRSTSVS